jgi:hypothetical protein
MGSYHAPGQHIVLRRTPSRTLKRPLEVDHARSPTRSSSSSPCQPVTARTVRAPGSSTKIRSRVRREAAEHERVVHGREVLAAHGELGLAVRAAPVVALGILRRRPRVVVAAAARRRRVADREPLERARRVGGQLEPLHRVHELRALGMDDAASRQPPARRSPNPSRAAVISWLSATCPRQSPSRTTPISGVGQALGASYEGQRHAHGDGVHAQEVAGRSPWRASPRARAHMDQRRSSRTRASWPYPAGSRPGSRLLAAGDGAQGIIAGVVASVHLLARGSPGVGEGLWRGL